MSKSDKITTPTFRAVATERSVVVRAARIALVVGIVLAGINHGHRLISSEIDGATLARICLTFLVPYCVSTYSSVLAVRDRMQRV
ncbi:nitrate/nitrite transporter NrtS [Limimaricola cinnabarinus]|uniref:nitrate/nitrite transporter NrtS n=1 Tax=Limimaricola cinnabarinus TaxID=1125964 RepID=UPI0024902FE7|nr:nitrate/nitrite transporter NrtS [Limimaricola cinnabarinus]